MESALPRTFRATLEAWLGQLLLPLVFFALLTYTATRFSGLAAWIGALGLLVLIGLAVYEYVLPMARNYLLIDARSIEGSMNGRYFHLYWTEVLAAWMYDRKKQRFLCLGTREGTLVVALRFLDDQAIWESVQHEAQPEALAENAIQRLPDFRDWDSTRKQALESTEPAMVTDHWLIQVIGWAGVTFFLFGMYHDLLRGQLLLGIVSGFFAAVCVVFLFSWGITQVSPAKIERYTLFGGWSIAWDDVRSIEIDLLDSVLVLVGENRQLVIPGPGMWSGSCKRAVLTMILAQAEQRHIPLRRTPRAVLRASRDTRIKK